MTLYHWDMPYTLYKQGGWDNRQLVQWYTKYAQVIFDNFKDLVKIYVLSNEMLIETEISQQAEDIVNKKTSAFTVVPAPQNLARALNQFNHKLLAVASAAKLFHTYHIREGEVGAAFSLFPSLSADDASQSQARLVDGIVNRWFLDPIYKGLIQKTF